MSNTIKDLSENKEEIKEINTFHTPSFGDEEFNINPHAQLDMQNSQFDQHHLISHHHHHQQQQQQLQQEHYNIQTNASQYIIDDSQQNWNTSASESQVYHNQDYWITPNQDLSYGYNTNEIHQQQQQQQQIQPQSQPHLIQHHHHHHQHQQQLLQQQPQQIHHLQPQQQSQQQLAQQHNLQQSQQMLMMPPPQQSPQMSPQMTNTINYIGQSPQQFCESGTTSDDSDDNIGIPRNPLKRPSPKPVGSGDDLKLNISKMAPIKKPKVQRKKKKKDPNEPQKPVSAYALFFRDTQAAIKGENPNASFGEVSTIVASMWDVLAPEHKDFYKKKTEDAKKDYLKTLAAYRANIVSKGNELENQPHQQELQQKSPTSVYQSPPRPQQSPSSVDNSNRNVITNNVEISSHMSPPSHTQQQQQLIQSPQIMLGLPIQPNQHMQYMHPQQQQQVQHSTNIYQNYNNTQVYKSPNAHNVDYNNTQVIMQQNMSPPSSQQHIITSPNRNQQINYTSSHHQQQSPNLNGNMAINNPIYGNQQHLQPQHVQFIQQQQHQQHQQQHQQQQQSHEQAQPQIHNNSEHQIQSNTTPHTLQPQKIEHEIKNQENVQQCIRQGCTNPAIVHVDWDDEFCSNDCVVIHCRGVFTDCIRSRAHEKPPTTVK